MPRKKRARSIHLINEPNWTLFKQAEKEEEKLEAFKYCDYFTHYEIADKAKTTAFHKWLVGESGLDKKTIKSIKKLPDHNFVTFGKFTYIGAKLGYMPEYYIEYFNQRLPEWLARAEKIIEEAEEAKEEAPKRPSIQDNMRVQVSPLLEEWDGHLDALIAGEFDLKSFDPHREMIAFKTPVKAPQAKIIKNEYHSDHEEAICIKEWKDPDIKEAYSHFKAKTRKDVLAFYEKIMQACDVIITTQKATRKTRKPRAVDKTKTVSKLKFQINYPELGIASINPIDIIGANEIWVYNTKTRKVGVYYAASEDPSKMGRSSITVSGTSLKGFDEEKSRQKTLRKPKDQIAGFKGRAKTKFKKAFDEIKTIDIKMTGRFNDTTIILKTF